MEQNEQIQHWSALAQRYNKYFGYGTKEGDKKLRRKVNKICGYGGITKDTVMLEIGCGTGAYTKELVKKAKCVYAIDISKSMIELAPKMDKIFYRVADAYNLPYANQCFDVVVGCYVLQYLDLNKVLPEIVRVLKPEGKFVFIEPNALNPIAFVITRWGLVKRLLNRPMKNTSFFSWELKNIFEGYKLDGEIKSLEFTANHAVASDIINQLLEKIPGVNRLGGSLIVYGNKAGGVYDHSQRTKMEAVNNKTT